jgi:dTDP-4-dehydrorhamnose reductase
MYTSCVSRNLRALQHVLSGQNTDVVQRWRSIVVHSRSAGAAQSEALSATDGGLSQHYSVVLQDKERLKQLLMEWHPHAVIFIPDFSPLELESSELSAAAASIVADAEAVSELCSDLNIWTLLLSSDQVFDGLAPPYAPNVTTHPVNAAGQLCTQLEVVVRRMQADAGILRIPVHTYWSPSNPVATLPAGSSPSDRCGDVLLQLLGEALSAARATAVPIDNSAIIYPTSVFDVASVCVGLLDRKLLHCGLYGTWHWSGKEGFTLHQLVTAVAEKLGWPKEQISRLQPAVSDTKTDRRLATVAIEVMGLQPPTNVQTPKGSQLLWDIARCFESDKC